MSKGLKKAAVFGLSAGLVLTSLAGCSKKDEFDTEETAITVNGDTVSVGVLNFAVRYGQAIYEDAYMSWGLTDPFNQDMFGTGTTLGESIKSQYATGLSHALLAEQKMDEYSVSLSDDEKAGITEAAAAFIADNEEEVLQEIGATQEIVERYLELTLIQSKVEAEMIVDVDTEVSDEEAAQRKIQYTFISSAVTDTEEEETESGEEAVTEADADDETEAVTEAAAEAETDAGSEEESASLETNDANKTQSADETEEETAADAEEAESEEETEAETEDPETVAARENARALAVEMIERIQDGEDFETVAEDMGQTVSENTFGSDYSITELVEATDGVEDGTLLDEPVETSSGFYVVKLVSQIDREATDAEKEEIVNERQEERINELYEEWEEDGEVSIDDSVLAKIVFDYHLTMYVEDETEEDTELLEEDSEAEETEADDAEAEETEAEETEAEETEAEETEAEETEAEETEAEETEAEETEADVTEAEETETEA